MTRAADTENLKGLRNPPAFGLSRASTRCAIATSGLGNAAVPRAVLATVLAGFVSLLTHESWAQTQVGNYGSHATSGRSVVITGATGETLRITPYGDYMVRIQVAKKGESFYADDRYEIVEKHDWNGTLGVVTSDSSLAISTEAADGISIALAKQPMRLAFSLKGQTAAVLSEGNGVTWSGNTITEAFASTTDEHFAGLGHETHGHIKKLDRQGTSLKVKSGSEGACVVPFYLSSRGYGVLLNTTFTHTITLAQNNVYSLNIDGEGYGGQMDYFFIAGPLLTQVVDRYTQLSGRPRMPQRSLFGLLLSDKSDPTNNGEPWWKQMITDHRNAGFAFDHQVNDNAWRASNEATSAQMNSWFEFRKDRYPDPAEYKKWCDDNGVTVTLDINRPGLSITPGWSDQQYGMPGTTACPDFTNVATRKWLWNLFFSKALDPTLKYPGDSIWLDEFDYPDQAHSMTLSSGKRWAEESINYHLDLQKACVKEGWDVAIGEAKRPYFWSRGITAGAQRWGSYWTGDIDGNWSDMADQVRAVQSAGISGFPYFNHDAGAHLNVTVTEDNLYRQWDMGFGSFTPIWKPHGPSHKRWPLQRNSTCQATAKTFITTRYQMIPYIYSYARIAQATGVPMARPMFLDDKDNATAWQKELQYMWGKEMLVAPNCSDGGNSVSVWLPKGNWYYFWDDKKYAGDKTESISAATGVVPAFVREGAIIPMAPFAKSTFFIPKDNLLVHAYTGADDLFQLFEDDGVTEKFRTKSESRVTDLRFTQQDLGVEVGASQGTYSGAPSSRSYQVIYHGLAADTPLYLNGTPISSFASQGAIPAGKDGTVWDSTKKLLNVYVVSRPMDSAFKISSTGSVPGTGGTTGSGGTSSTGGNTGRGGTSGTGGNTVLVGTSGTGGNTGRGGTSGTGGNTVLVGTSGTGGNTGRGGTSGTGGNPGVGGSIGGGAAQGTGGGIAGSGGTTAGTPSTGGTTVVATAGSSGNTGGALAATGGRGNSGTTGGVSASSGGSSNDATLVDATQTPSSGCSCTTPVSTRGSRTLALLFGFAIMSVLRRRKN
jgi:alpha-glucosidase (family GH31 glycosyl hydrolase)